MSAPVRAKRRLYLDETRTRVLEDGDPDARYLLCVPDGDIPYETAVKYDLLQGEPSTARASLGPEAEQGTEPEAKAKPAPPNKSRAGASNK
jgi:hypothetical protein